MSAWRQGEQTQCGESELLAARIFPIAPLHSALPTRLLSFTRFHTRHYRRPPPAHPPSPPPPHHYPQDYSTTTLDATLPPRFSFMQIKTNSRKQAIRWGREWIR